jgi:hypothetical protein
MARGPAKTVRELELEKKILEAKIKEKQQRELRKKAEEQLKRQKAKNT